MNPKLDKKSAKAAKSSAPESKGPVAAPKQDDGTSGAASRSLLGGRWRLVAALVGLALALLLAHRQGVLRLSRLGFGGRQGPAQRPDLLLTYSKFKVRYPRNHDPARRLSEYARREMIFDSHLVSVGRHNLGYLIGLQSFLGVQSPFREDRLDSEQEDILGQLDDFNMTQILLNAQIDITGDIDEQLNALDSLSAKASAPGPDKLDVAVSGLFGAKQAPKTADLETSGSFDRWFTRATKGDAYFEIPNYPLDAQPDPDRVTHIDADLRACTGPIKNQLDCGACYAFSWLSLVEWHHCKQAQAAEPAAGPQVVDLSEQHIVDCGHLAKLAGCRDGFLTKVRDFTHVFGAELEQAYPYKGKQGNCRKSEGSLQVKSVEFRRVVVERAHWEELLAEQPLLVEVRLPADVLSYKRGVHPGNNCKLSMAHGMLLVGHGRQAGVPYWLLRNSMGAKWGENGYLRLSREAPMAECFGTAFVSKFRFKSLAGGSGFDDFYAGLAVEPRLQPERRPEAGVLSLLRR